MNSIAPWTPITVNTEDDAIHLGVWGREYTATARSPITSILSQGSELLASPIRLVVREDGEDFTVCDGFSNFPMAGSDGREVDVVSSAESREFVFNTAMHLEYDGCTELCLTVSPRGRSVKECFGLEAAKPFEYRLDRLWLEIPLRREVARYYQYYPHTPGRSVLESGGELTEAMELPFKEQIFLSNDGVGLLFFCDTERGFSPVDNPRAIEVIPSENEVLLRIRLFDEEPAEWREFATGRIDLDPITFRLGLMATPVKPIPDGVFAERAVHIDCYKKILEDYEDFLSSPFPGTDEITFDRLKRLGVNTLYIHEKWNDLQNSPVLTERTAARLRYIIKECHDRGIRVIPYFGYEMSTAAPYYNKLRDSVWRYSRPARRGSWYRQPPQRNIRVCQTSEWSEFFTEGIDRLMTEYGFDGIYLDGTAYVWPCMNESHGCGFCAPDGVRRPSYPVWGTRKTMKRLHEIVCGKHGGIINCHAGSAFNLPALSFATSLWDGEVFQTGFLKGEIESLPDRYFRALYTGRNIGLPIYMLCYLNPPIWDFRMALATALPFGIFPKPNDVGEPLEIMSGIWRVFDSFAIEKASFLPYYTEEELPVKASDPAIKVSVYRHPDRVLAVVSSTEKATDSTFTVSAPFKRLYNAVTEELLGENGSATVSLRGFDFLLIEARD